MRFDTEACDRAVEEARAEGRGVAVLVSGPLGEPERGFPPKAENWANRNMTTLARRPRRIRTKRKVPNATVAKAHIVSVLESVGWRISGDHRAGRILGLKRTTLEARMSKLGITRPS